MIIKFLGAAGQVTGSCYYVEAGGARFLVDCGMVQERAYLERNWNPFPVPPGSLDTVILTHVHVDHSGLLPKLVREGFRKSILTTPPSADLLPIVLRDAARIQEEEAETKKKRHEKEGRQGPYPEVPLYTEVQAEAALGLVKPVRYGESFALGDRVTARLHDAGHILGSAMIELSVERGGGRPLTAIFSGDMGQRDRPLIHDPSVFDSADAAVMEATYGDRDHEDPANLETMLSRIIQDTVLAGGNIVVPVFAIERAQEMMFYLSRLLRGNRIPRLPVFLDSPMATDVTGVFLRHFESLDAETLGLFRSGRSPFSFPGLRYVRTQEDSKSINAVPEPCLIMAGSGMCTAGRIKHHLVHNISRPESTILFVGYQSAGTLGSQILAKPETVRIFGESHAVRARIEQIHSFSAHAGRTGLLRWLGHFNPPLPVVFLTHGEPATLQALAGTLREERGFRVHIPAYGEDAAVEP
ncbi:MAG: MBL fold hydrolase [Candidatus Aminicenantes bacterium RBG_16_63_16]|nr:MAG: MBL fold hydrolase [Candidatus Aminicenantes bacterium RBG_16_63_16]